MAKAEPLIYCLRQTYRQHNEKKTRVYCIEIFKKAKGKLAFIETFGTERSGSLENKLARIIELCASGHPKSTETGGD